MFTKASSRSVGQNFEAVLKRFHKSRNLQICLMGTGIVLLSAHPDTDWMDTITLSETMASDDPTSTAAASVVVDDAEEGEGVSALNVAVNELREFFENVVLRAEGDDDESNSTQREGAKAPEFKTPSRSIHIIRIECEPTKSNSGSSSSNDSKRSESSGNGVGKGPSDKPDAVEKLLNEYGPTLEKIAFGGMMGICCGVTFKRISNELAYTLGLVTKVLNTDGDGKLTTEDLVHVWKELKNILSFNLPGMSVLAGVALGLYFGR